jgi:predicted O-methyltransferase YrrM
VRSSIRRALGGAYRSVAGPMGQRAVDAALDDGLPLELEEPLRVLLGRGAPPSVRAVQDRVEEARAAVAARSDRFRFHREPSAPDVRWAVLDDAGDLTAAWFAEHVSISKRWATFLHLLAEAVGARTVLELGACIGVSSAYLASARDVTTFVTIDASPDLARLARETLAHVTDDARVVVGRFDEVLPAEIALLSIDLAYVDGHHDGAALRRYVDAIAPKVVPGGVLVLDDIRLYREMWESWQVLSAGPGLRAAVDLGHFGLLVRDPAALAGEALHVDLSRFTGRWPVGPSRSTVL